MSGLRILVSFKVTPDFEALREADWLAGAADDAAGGAARGVETRYVRRVLNCFDESALEMALRLSDARAERGSATSLGALSVGGRETEPYLKTLLALGYDRAARVEPEAALDFAPAVTASVIASFVRRDGPPRSACCSAAAAAPETAAPFPSWSPRRWGGRA